MAALRSRCGHYIFALWFLLLLFFFPRLISAVADFMSTILAYFDINFSAVGLTVSCSVSYYFDRYLLNVNNLRQKGSTEICIFITDHFSGPGRAISPLCVCVSGQ